MEMIDITATDLAHAPGPEDRIFRITAQPTETHPDGVYVVKVKTIHDEAGSQPGRERLAMTASLCDADGKAYATPSGAPAVHPSVHEHWVGAERDLTGQGQPDVLGHIDIIQRQVAETILTAMLHRAAVLTAPGVGRQLRGLLQ